MTVGPLFTISSINIARAAAREAERGPSIDLPVVINVGSRDPEGTSQLFIEVVARGGGTRLLDVDDASVGACLTRDHRETTHQMVSDLIAQLADQIRTAARELAL